MKRKTLFVFTGQDAKSGGLRQSSTEEIADQPGSADDVADPFADAPPAAFAEDAFQLPQTANSGGESAPGHKKNKSSRMGGKRRNKSKFKGKSNMQLLESDEDSDDAHSNNPNLSNRNSNNTGMASAPGAIGVGAAASGAVEEKRYTFDTKPMGFQIEAEDERICVRNVRPYTQAEQYGIKKKWQIVEVNGYRDWLSMLNILEQSLGPFDIVFAAKSENAPVQGAHSPIINKDRASSVIASEMLNLVPVAPFTAVDQSVISKITNPAAKDEVIRLQNVCLVCLFVCLFFCLYSLLWIGFFFVCMEIGGECIGNE